MNIRPLSNHVIIKPDKEEKTTTSGIVLPESADKKKQRRGVVIAVGPGKYNESGNRIPPEVKTGDKVIFKEPWSEDNKLSGSDKEELFLVDEDDILAVLE